jgi:hypothetical protein
MIGFFWNIRGLEQIGRIPTLVSRIRDNHVDFIGILETKKKNYTPSFLRPLTRNIPFNWFHQPARGSAGGILVGANSDLFVATLIHRFSVSIMLIDKKNQHQLEACSNLWVSL